MAQGLFGGACGSEKMMWECLGVGTGKAAAAGER